MGNPILSDDAVGLRLAAEVARRIGPRAGLDVVTECSVGGLALLDVVAGYDLLVVIDAIRTRDSEPGAWHHLTLVDLSATRNLTSVHDVNFATALELGRWLGFPVADDANVHVFGVEVCEVDVFSESMSPALERAFPALADEMTHAVRHLLATADTGRGPCTDGPRTRL